MRTISFLKKKEESTLLSYQLHSPLQFFLVFFHTVIRLSLNNSKSQVSFAIADSSDVYVALYLCIADRETDQMEQESVLLSCF